MGQSASRHERPSKRLDFLKLSPIESALPLHTRTNAVAVADFALGVRLSWLLSRFAATPAGDGEQTIQMFMEEAVHPLSAGGAALDLDAVGPATHVALVHPSTPAIAFMKAILNHLGMDPKRALMAGDAPLSPRSPLLPFNPSTDSKLPRNAAAAGGSCAEPEARALDGPFPNSADHLYHSTFLHVDFLAHAPADYPAAASAQAQPSPAAAAALTAPAPAAPSMPQQPDRLALYGDAAERVLARMPGEPSAWLVVDPSGAIFTDPRAIRAVAAVVAVLRKPPRAAGNGRPPRLQLASSVGGADWAPVAAAFGRVPGLAPDDPAAAHAVCEAVLESARLQFTGHWPLLHLFASRASYSLEVDCAFIGGGGGGGDSGKGGGVGGGVPGGLPAPPARQRHLLPGQIETAEKLAIERVPETEGEDHAECQGESFEDMVGGGDGGGSGGAGGGGGRGHGPSSQSGIERFARDLFGGRTPPSSPPVVPPTDAEALKRVRGSRSPTQSAISFSAPSRHLPASNGQSSSAALAASGRGAACAIAAGSALAPAQPVPYSERGGGSTLSAPSARSQRAGLTSTVATATAGGVAVCLSNPSVISIPVGSPSLAATAAAAAAASVGVGDCPLKTAMASVASSACCGGGLEGSSQLVTYAVEAARRYAALLEGVGLWAAAAGVLEACVCAVGERWGHRSGRMAALLAQLGKLQGLQGLYRSAEITWRQALEALESIHGPVGVPVLQCRVALAQVLAALREAEGEAEAMLRGALAGLDSALGPSAAETLAAREALAGFLVGEGRWAEAEVLYQGLLLSMEEAPPQPRAAAASARQRQGGGGGGAGVTLSGVPRAPSRAAEAQQLAAGAAWPGGAGHGRSEAQSGGGGGGGGGGGVASPRRSDSRSRMAWGAVSELGAAAAAAAAAGAASEGAGAAAAAPAELGLSGGYATAAGAGATFHRTVLPPLQSGSGSLPPVVSGALCSPPLPPLPSLGGGGNAVASVASDAAASQPQSSNSRGDGGGGGGGGGGRGGLGPGNADLLAWSGAAAALADVVAAVQREYGGVNELYEGMHLAGPEGTTAADLAALAAVCPRSGACIAAVVNVRRLTDADALYDTALAARRAALYDAHPAMLDLQRQYARHLIAAGEHGRAEAICRAALEQLTLAMPPGLESRCHVSDAGTVVAHHPAEVSLRHMLGAVLQAAGSLGAAAAALAAAVEVAERLVAAGDLAAADARRVEALDCLSGVLWQRAQAGRGSAAAVAAAASQLSPPTLTSPLAARAIECKRQSLELTASVCGERHERLMRGWVGLGQMLEGAGDLAAAERAYEAAAEVALHRHSRLSAATKAIFRQLQRVYQAQGRTADAQVLEHMYRLRGGLLAAPAAPAATSPVPAQA